MYIEIGHAISLHPMKLYTVFYLIYVRMDNFEVIRGFRDKRWEINKENKEESYMNEHGHEPQMKGYGHS